MKYFKSFTALFQRTGVFWHDTFWYGVAASFGRVSGLVLVPIYTRALSSADYGVLDLILAITCLAAIPGMWQLESAVSRFYYESERDGQLHILLSSAFWVVLASSASMVVIMMVAAPMLAGWLLKDECYSLPMMVGALAIVTNNLLQLFSLVVRFQQKKGVFVCSVICQLVVSIIVSWWLVFKIGVLGAIIGQLAGAVIAIVVLWRPVSACLGFHLGLPMLKKMFMFSFPQVFSVGGGWINSYANRFVILAYLSLAEVGQYGVAARIVSPLLIMATAFRMAWGPFSWKTFEAADHCIIFRRVHTVFYLMLFALATLVGLAARPLLKLLTTPEYFDGAPVVGFLALAMSLALTKEIVGMGIFIKKKTIYTALYSYIGAATNVICLLVMVPQFKIMGVAFSALISAIVTLVLYWWTSERLYPIGFHVRWFVLALFVSISILILGILTGFI